MSDSLYAFDLDDPKLPKAVKERAMSSGGFPYSEKMDEDDYAETLRGLQVELVKLQSHLAASGDRVLILFEGRDAAGKGGAINAYRENLNPRVNIAVALPKPSDREATQWYFQRYVDWLPAAGETVLFDRSYYNRAGVEPVMGFCTGEETETFLRQVPHFERMLTDDGIRYFKFYIDIGREMQMKRFHERRHDPLKTWKLSEIDYKALKLWDRYSEARDRMLEATDTDHAPWTVIRGNDKRRARIGVIQHVLSHLDYKGADKDAVGTCDPKIVLSARDFLRLHRR